MNEIITILGLFLIGGSSWAGPNLGLIKDVEWFGECHQFNSKGKEAVKSDINNRVQFSYSFQNSSLISWTKSYKGGACTELIRVEKYTYKCEPQKTRSTFADCKKIAAATSKDAKNWKTQSKVIHNDVRSTMSVMIEAYESNTVKILIIDETEELASEVLTTR